MIRKWNNIFWDRHARHLARSRDERNRYEVHLGPSLGSHSLASIMLADAEQIKVKLMAQGRAAATVRHVLGTLGRIYNFILNSREKL